MAKNYLLDTNNQKNGNIQELILNLIKSSPILLAYIAGQLSIIYVIGG